MSIRRSTRDRVDLALRAGIIPSVGRQGSVFLGVPDGGRSITLRRTYGVTSHAGDYWARQTGREVPAADHVQEEGETIQQGSLRRLRLPGGGLQTLAKWTRRGWQMTAAGRVYYRDKKDRWLVRIPVIRYLRSKNGKWWRDVKAKDYEPSSEFPSLGQGGIWEFPSTMPEDQQRAQVWHDVQVFLDNLRVEDDNVIVSDEYERKILDTSREPLVSIESMGVTATGRAQVETVINQPLMSGTPWVHSCLPFEVKHYMAQAFEDSGNTCVESQLALIKRRDQPLMSLDEIFDCMKNAYKELYAGKESDPYDNGYYPSQGVTVEMLKYFCQANEVQACVVFNNRKILHYIPKDTKHTETISVVVLDGHAFFLQCPKTKEWVSKWSVTDPQSPAFVELKKLAMTRQDRAPPFEEWLPYQGPESLEPEKHYWDFDLLEARSQLLAKQWCPKVCTKGPSPTDWVALRQKLPGGTAVIHKVDYPNQCIGFCKTFKELTGRELIYRGETIQTLTMKALQILLKHTRQKFLAEPADRQCVRCGAVTKCQTDHSIPLCEGGTNDPSNLAPLCKACHAEKSSEEMLPQVCMLESSFNRQMWDDFVMCPKPTQTVCKWHEPSPEMDVHLADIKRCRTTAILELALIHN